MLKEGRKIVYLDDAVVYDEKIQKIGSFGNQRRRWLSTIALFQKIFLLQVNI
jgi:cellulose synthase/poly-beta-1,6-N-acetylglucosamine synthase-like glycosyltransferase